MYIAHYTRGWSTAHSSYDIDAIPKGSFGSIYDIPDNSILLILQNNILKTNFVVPDLSEFQFELFKECINSAYIKKNDKWMPAYGSYSIFVYKICSTCLPDEEEIEKFLAEKYGENAWYKICIFMNGKSI